MCTFCEKIYPNKDWSDIVFGCGKYSSMEDEIERFITINEDGIYDLNLIPDGDPYALEFFPDVKFCPYCGCNLAEREDEEYDRWCNTCEFKHLESECLGCAEYDEYDNLINLRNYKKEENK